MPSFIDSHCHLDFPQLAVDRPHVLARARAAGLVRMLNIGTRMGDFDAVYQTAQNEPDVDCSFGIHPHHVAEAGEQPDLDTIIAKASAPKVVGVGETGLDFFYDSAPRAVQEESFRRHIRAARALDLPLIIHSREAEADTIRILKEEGPVTGVLHCFSSRRVLAEEGLALGLFISLSGILTFKKSQELRDIARDIPLDRLLIETDSPYLAPEPFRGQTAEPSFVIRTAKLLADLKEATLETIALHTTENYFRLFSKAKRRA